MAQELHSNEFWKKKAYHALKIRDTNKNGKISKADFDLIVQRYRKMGAPEGHLKQLADEFERHVEFIGGTSKGCPDEQHVLVLVVNNIIVLGAAKAAFHGVLLI